MSLKAFHVVFISIAILLSIGFGFWGINNYENTGSFVNLLMGIGSLLTAAALAIYFRWFLKKLKDQSYL